MEIAEADADCAQRNGCGSDGRQNILLWRREAGWNVQSSRSLRSGEKCLGCIGVDADVGTWNRGGECPRYHLYSSRSDIEWRHRANEWGASIQLEINAVLEVLDLKTQLLRNEVRGPPRASVAEKLYAHAARTGRAIAEMPR